MQYEGTWLATADKSRKLVFEPNGVGYVEVQTERFPYFRWRISPEGVFWQFFKDAGFSEVVSKEMQLDCSVTHEKTQTTLEFQHAPISFGFKRFSKHEA